MYDDILVPTDGSDAAEPAIREAVDLAALTDATVHGLYVVDTRDYSTLPESRMLDLTESFESQGQRAVLGVEEAVEEAGVEGRTTVEQGLPHEVIVEYAEDSGVDLIVMGTHGRTGLNRFLLGSVTEKVIRSAPIPVHVVRFDDED